MQQIERDEIDLAEIFRYIGRFFNRLGRGFQNCVDAVISNKFVVLFIVTLGLGLAFLAYSFTKPFYTSSMTLMLANIRNEFMENQLNSLTVMIEEDNYETVADRLDISLEAARQIKEMSFTSMDQDRIEEDSILTGSPFQVQLDLYDNRLFSVMEPAIVSYLESNRYFSKQKLIKQRQMASMISKLKGEITSIDSMKTTVGSPRGPVNGFVYGQPVDPTNLYRESITMYEQQVELEADLEQLENVQVVTGFTPRLRPTGPSLKKYLAISGAISLLIGIVVALSLDRKKRQKFSI